MTQLITGITPSGIEKPVAVDDDGKLVLAGSGGSGGVTGTTGFASSATITRAANTNPYFANDVYGGAFELPNFGSNGGHVLLTAIRSILNISALPAGMSSFLLYLYSITPPSNIPDNAAFSIFPEDLPYILTPGGIPLGGATLATGGGRVVLQAENLNIQLKLLTTSVWGYLVTQGNFTPGAASETGSLTSMSLGLS